MTITSRTMIITSIKCDKKFGSAIKLNVQGAQRIDWTAFNQGVTKPLNVRVALPITPANIMMDLFDNSVSTTLSADSESVFTGASAPVSKTFSYRGNKGKYIVSYRIETTAQMAAIATPAATSAA